MADANLWTEYKAAPTDAIKKKIVLSYIKLVYYVIHHSKFINVNILDDRDYLQFGIEGLSEAIDRFDPEFGTKFETYAIKRIRGKIIDELRKLQKKPRVLNSENEVVFYSNISMSNIGDDEEGYSLEETIPNDSVLPDESLEKQEMKEFLIEAINNLEERDRLIISLYYYENLGYKEIAKALSITVSRVSQVHTRIIESLKSKLAFTSV
ncbi:MAG: sigma-70 family RNA polymerase sigma factor [Ignavibacteriaceae bacterium]|jgi:RNA polymerase sigma factor for flagellar operon FliA